MRMSSRLVNDNQRSIIFLFLPIKLFRKKHMIFQRRGFPLIVMLVFSLFFFGACKQQMEKDEAESHLRAFDYELVRMTQNIRKTTSLATLEFLSGTANPPLPYMFGNEKGDESSQEFHFESVRGIYRLDTISNTFIKTAKSDSIIIYFHNPVLNHVKTKLTLAQFKEEPSNSAFQFPTEIDMVMEASERTIMRIDHNATIEYGIPAEMNFYGLFDNYEIKSAISTRLRRTSGRLRLETHVFRNGEQIFDWLFHAGLGFEEGVTYRLRKVRMDVGIFPARFRVRVNNHDIPLRTNDYISEFNESSTITIHSTTKNQLVGHVELHARENSDKLDYIVRFNGGSYLFLEDFLITARSILNIRR